MIIEVPDDMDKKTARLVKALKKHIEKNNSKVTLEVSLEISKNCDIVAVENYIREALQNGRLLKNPIPNLNRKSITVKHKKE